MAEKKRTQSGFFGNFPSSRVFSAIFGTHVGYFRTQVDIASNELTVDVCTVIVQLRAFTNKGYIGMQLWIGTCSIFHTA